MSLQLHVRRLTRALPTAVRSRLWLSGHLCSYPVDFTDAEIALCDWAAPYTMTSPEKIIGLVNAVRYVATHRIPGDIVECGVWRGGSAMVIGRTLSELGDLTRSLHLFDTFTGMTAPGEHDRRYDGATADALLAREHYRCEAGKDAVRSNLQLAGYPMHQFQLVAGDVIETLPAGAPDSIALLRLDTDWYESTRHELACLYDRVSPGGVVIVDDYGHWQGARRAVDEFLSTLERPPLLTRLDFDGRMWIKT